MKLAAAVYMGVVSVASVVAWAAIVWASWDAMGYKGLLLSSAPLILWGSVLGLGAIGSADKAERIESLSRLGKSHRE